MRTKRRRCTFQRPLQSGFGERLDRPQLAVQRPSQTDPLQSIASLHSGRSYLEEAAAQIVAMGR
jgi:hypothetical protein